MKTMEKIKAEAEKLQSLINDYQSNLTSLQKYPRHNYYQKRKKALFLEINNSLKIIKRLTKDALLKEIEPILLKFIDDKTPSNEKEQLHQELELKWQDLKLDLNEVKEIRSDFKIPEEIPPSDILLDLEEAIVDYQNHAFLSTLVMCRRAYEGAVISKYKQLEKKEPTKQIVCKNCKNIVKNNVFFGIVELHQWAVEKKVISEKFKDIGFLIPNLGAGGAHPTQSFPRDSEVANIVITTTISLLKQIYSK